jgi:hypothetical protein
MNTVCKKALALSLAITCLISQVFLFIACYSSKIKYDQDRENIKSIEIVEALPFSYGDDDVFSHTLINIDDIDSFLNELEKIKYTSYLYNGVLGINQRVLGVKITYNNYDFEIFSDSLKNSYYHGKSYSVRPFGFFEEEEFYNLLFKYLSLAEEFEFIYMHDVSKISSIEIVNSTVQGDGSVECETLSIIADMADFIDRLSKIDYVYTNEEITNDMYRMMDQKNAVKITYQNGNYEIFSHNHRDEVFITDMGEESTFTGTYIGSFDEEAFNALVSQYLNEDAN